MARQKLSLTRDQLASFLSDFEQIKQFELLFSTVDTIDTLTLDEINISAGTANAAANDALAQISVLTNQTALLSLAPPDLGGTVTSVGLSGGTTGITISGPNPITTSGTFTLGGLLGIANGGTNSTATPTAGGIAYGTGTAYAFSSAGTAGQFLTSTGGGTPTWSTASSPFGNPAYWGSFWDTTDQAAAAANTAYAVTLNSADPLNNGTTVVSGSRVTFAHAGIYSLTFSIQFMNTDNQIHDANVWMRKNGTNIPDSDTKLSIQNRHGGVNGYGLMTVNFVFSLAAGDYIEMVWAATNTSISIQSEPAGTTPVTPSVPGVIFTAVSAPHIGIGYAGVASTTSMTIGTGSKTFTTNVSSTDTAFTVGNRVRLIYDATNYMEGTITAFSGTSMTVNVDTTAGSGTYTTWSVGLTGVVNTGVTSFSGGSTGLTPATATSGAVTLAGTLGVGYGGTGQTSYTNGQLLIGNSTGNTLTKATLTAGTNVSITNGAGSITINATDQYVGTVTSVSVVSANGLAGTVANATTTPAITLSTTVTGLVKGNGTALSAASAGTDYVAPGAITTSGLTMATARLLGRTTASTGAVEEITVGTGLSLSGGSLTNSAPDQTVSLTAGTGISISGAYPSFTITNSAPDQVVSLTGAGTTVVTGTYPSFTITSNDQYVGTVTSVSGTGTVNGITLTGTVTSTGSLTLGGTLSGVSLTSQVTGTLPIANGGTGSTSTTYCSLTTNVTGTLPVGNGGTGATTFTANALLKGNTTSAISASNVSDNGSTVSIASGIGFSIARTTVTSPAAADGNVFSGTYTPTSFNTTNIAASTPQSAQYLRVGNTVTVSGQIDIDPTATGFAILGLSLPIASAITSAVQLSGVFNCPDAAGGGVYGDAANDRATFQFTASSAANLTYYYTFTYRVL